MENAFYRKYHDKQAKKLIKVHKYVSRIIILLKFFNVEISIKKTSKFALTYTDMRSSISSKEFYI